MLSVGNQKYCRRLTTPLGGENLEQKGRTGHEVSIARIKKFSDSARRNLIQGLHLPNNNGVPKTL